MPLFKKNEEPVRTAPAPTHHAPRTSTSSKNGFFNRRRSPSPDHSVAATRSSTSSGGLFHRNHEDPSITGARQRVAAAEAAERDADRALNQARQAVRDAHAHVHQLEREAAEDARLAKIKQGQAKDISKSAKHLGRHGL